MIFDVHNDFPTALNALGYGEYVRAVPGIVTAAIWTSGFKTDVYTRVKSLQDALCRLHVPIAIEDLGYSAAGDMYIDMDYSAYFYCSLTWNFDNAFAGGALGDGNVTGAGKRLISLINGKCALDVAHLNRKSFFSAIDLAERPICSHTGFAAHPRCLDGEMIAALIARKGIIGLSAVKKFTGAQTAAELAAVIDGFVQRYGIDYLCLGTDFCGSDDLPDDFGDYTGIDRVSNALLRLGYSYADIDRIFYTNAKHFYEEL